MFFRLFIFFEFISIYNLLSAQVGKEVVFYRYIDSTASLSVQEVVSNLQRFEKTTYEQLNFAPFNGVIWLSVPLNNDLNQPMSYVVEIDNLLINPDFFILTNYGLSDASKSKTPDRHSHAIQVNIPPLETINVVIKIPTHGFTTSIPLTVYEHEQYIQHQSIHTLMIGSVIGLLGLVLVLTSFIWIIGKSRTSFYLFGFILTSSIYFFYLEGLSYYFAGGSHTLFQLYLAKAMMPLASGFIALFYIDFLSLKEKSPQFYKKSLRLIATIMATALFYPLLTFFPSFLYNYTYFILLIASIFCGVILHQSFRFEPKISFVFGIGIFLLAVSVILKFAYDYALIPQTPIFQQIPKVGYFGLLLSVFYGIALKYQKSSRELVLLNQRLEQIVVERTAEINNQNEELKTQAEELNSQREQLLLQKEELKTQTEELRAQAELLASQKAELERLNLAVSNTANLIYLFSAEGELIWYNHAFSSLLGINGQSSKRKKNVKIYDISANKNIDKIFSDCVNHGKTITYETAVPDKNNQTRYYQTSLTPIFENNNLKYVIAIDSEISKLKEYEKELETQHSLLLAQKEELELKQAEITDSLRYAERIQKAILPKISDIRKFFPNSFVVFMPKDIVSGDFYWFHRIENKYVFVSVDCTGHGVPGAFMSIIGTYLLNNIIIQNRETRPAEILKQLNRKLKISLKSDNSEDQTNDGMDVALVTLNLSSQKLTFAGAMRSIFLCANKEFVEIKGDKIPITSEIAGNTIAQYNEWEFDIVPENRFYMFSDGIIDQFGGPENKKFLTKRFKQLLIDIQSYTMEEQQQTIIQTIYQWRGTNPQVDDILVIGVEV